MVIEPEFHTMHYPIRSVLLTLCLISLGSIGFGFEQQSKRINVVLILADDLGWSDLGCYGADLHETPYLDRLASDGLRFTFAYSSAPVCTPTRAAIMTGKSPARLGITVWSENGLRPPTNHPWMEAPSSPHLPREEITLAEHLQALGYRTSVIGKWHLGDGDHSAETQGFEIAIGGTHWGAPPTFFWPYRSRLNPFDRRDAAKEFRYVPDLFDGTEGEYLTDRLTMEALQTIDSFGESPFFLMLSHHAPHTPIEAKEEDIAYFKKKLSKNHRHQHPTYAAMIRSLDESVGRIREHLKTKGLSERTLVLVTSDNGGYIGVDSKTGIRITDNAPLRSGKGSLYEGGIRVPLLIYWPGVTHPDSICHEPVILTDLFPTLLGAARSSGSSIPPSSPTEVCDGFDLVSLCRDPFMRLPRESLHFHYPHYYHAPKTSPCSAIIRRGWKLIESYEDNHPKELYDLREDPSERLNLLATQASIAESLQRELDEWKKTVGARLPTRLRGTAIP